MDALVMGLNFLCYFAGDRMGAVHARLSNHRTQLGHLTQCSSPQFKLLTDNTSGNVQTRFTIKTTVNNKNTTNYN